MSAKAFSHISPESQQRVKKMLQTVIMAIKQSAMQSAYNSNAKMPIFCKDSHIISVGLQFAQNSSFSGTNTLAKVKSKALKHRAPKTYSSEAHQSSKTRMTKIVIKSKRGRSSWDRLIMASRKRRTSSPKTIAFPKCSMTLIMRQAS